MAKKKAAPKKKKDPRVALAEMLRNQGITEANSLFTRSQGDLRHVHEEVSEYLNNMGKQGNDIYGRAGKVIADIQGQGIGAIDQNTNSTRDAAMSELERLGIQQSGMGSYDQDANWLKNLASQNGRDAAVNNNTRRADFGTIGRLLGGMNAGSHQSGVGQAVNLRNTQITDLRNQFARARLEIEAQKQAEARARAASRSYGGGGGGSYGGGSYRPYSRYSGGNYTPRSSGGSGGGSSDYGYDRDKPKGVSAAIPVDALSAALTGGALGAFTNGKRNKPKTAPSDRRGTGRRPQFKGIR